MSNITTLNDWDSGNTFRTNLNTNFSNLNTDKLEASDITWKQDILTEGAFVDGDKTKLDWIESWADVTDTANVTAAWALMDSEVTNLAQVKAFDSSDYAAASHTHTHADITDYDTELAGTTNTTAFTPTADYHPATKKYVDDNAWGWASAINDLTDVTITTPSNGQALIYNSTSWDWENTTLWGGWDMLAATYDPTSVAWDAFSMDNMVEWTDTKILTAAERTKLTNTSGTNTGDQTITLTGDVTGSGTWSFATTIADEAVTLPKMAHIATNRMLGRATAGVGDVESLTATQARDNMGVGTWDSPQFANINLWHATDTTIGRTSAWVINVEGDDVLTAGNTQTLTNKTISASSNVLWGVTMTLWSDATGDIYYRNASGVLTRLWVGTDSQVLTLASWVPSWEDASGGGWGVEAFYDAWNSWTSKTIDWDDSINQKVTLTDDCTFTFSNPEDWWVYVLKLIQDGTWSRSVTLPASVKTQYWALNISTGAGDIDILTLIYDGTNYFANLGKNYE